MFRDYFAVTSNGTRLAVRARGIQRAGTLAVAYLYPNRTHCAIWAVGAINNVRQRTFSAVNHETSYVTDRLTVTVRSPDARRSKAPTESVKRQGGAT